MLVNRVDRVIYCNKPGTQIEDLCKANGWSLEPVTQEDGVRVTEEWHNVADVPAEIVVDLLGARVAFKNAGDRLGKRSALRLAFSAARRWMRYSRRQQGGA